MSRASAILFALKPSEVRDEIKKQIEIIRTRITGGRVPSPEPAQHSSEPDVPDIPDIPDIPIFPQTTRITGGRRSPPDPAQRSDEHNPPPNPSPSSEEAGDLPQSTDLADTSEQQIPDVGSDPMERSGRIRILIIGREGSGKMTILQSVCNSTEGPEIYNDQGEKFKPGVKQPSEARHNIDHEVAFNSDRRFVFHVSLSFEERFEDEFENMKTFITEHVDMAPPRKQIHAIWYCIPMDQFHHAVSSAERKFFDECDTGSVPVVVIFTKWDALVTQASLLEYLELPPKDQVKKQRKHAQENFDSRNIWGELCQGQFPPKAYVQLERMDKPGAECNILLEQTRKVLGDPALQGLLTVA